MSTLRNWRRYVVGNFILMFALLFGYAIFATVRLNTLERRLQDAEALLQEAEQRRPLHTIPLGSSSTPIPPFTNGAFLFDGLRMERIDELRILPRELRERPR